MKIEYLADHLELLPEIAALTFTEWKDLCTSIGRDLGQVKEILAQRAVKDRIPLTLIVLENNQFVATGSIKLSEPDTQKDVSPWLDMMYVESSRRGCGIGRLLLEALEKKAWEMGAKTLYLSTDEAEDFYAKNNWSVLEHQKAVDGKIVAFMAKELSRVQE
jgi:GNAT superfamily N-acetyltransferase